MKQKINQKVAWEVAPRPIPYEDAISLMQQRVFEIQQQTAPELLWLLEHPPLYTAGPRTPAWNILNLGDVPLYATERGGLATYHGPGQQIGYVMLDLKSRGVDLKSFVQALEEWLLEALLLLGVHGFRREGKIGLWVHPESPAKIAALGLKVTKGVTSHGFALNVSTDLKAFERIIPCGLQGEAVTSLEALGKPTSPAEVQKALEKTYPEFLKKLGAPYSLLK